MYKLISLDLDGTLLNSKGNVSQNNLDVIVDCQSKGIHTVVATGRPPRYTFSMIPKLLTKAYCICYNGAQIYYNQELIYEQCIQPSMVSEILSEMSDYKIAVEIKNVIYTNFDMREIWPEIEAKDLSEVDTNEGFCKIIILNEKSIDYNAFSQRYSNHINSMLTDQNRLIEIVAHQVSKCTAIEWIAQREKIELKDIIAFGDDHNDVEIIQGVGYGVAMLNANEYVKSIADHVTLSNDSDGVAITLMQLIGDNNE